MSALKSITVKIDVDNANDGTSISPLTLLQRIPQWSELIETDSVNEPDLAQSIAYQQTYDRWKLFPNIISDVSGPFEYTVSDVVFQAGDAKTATYCDTFSTNITMNLNAGMLKVKYWRSSEPVRFEFSSAVAFSEKTVDFENRDLVHGSVFYINDTKIYFPVKDFSASYSVTEVTALINQYTSATGVTATTDGSSYIDLSTSDVHEFTMLLNEQMLKSGDDDFVQSVVYQSVIRCPIFTTYPKASLTLDTTTDVNATTNVFTSVAHGLIDDDIVVLTGADLPAPLAAATNYYVVTATDDTFQLSATSGGAAIDITDTGTGTFSVLASGVTGSNGAYQYEPVTFPVNARWMDRYTGEPADPTEQFTNSGGNTIEPYDIVRAQPEYDRRTNPATNEYSNFYITPSFATAADAEAVLTIDNTEFSRNYY